MSAAHLAEAHGQLVDDARTRQPGRFEALGHEGRVDVKQLGQAAAALAPEVAPEVSWGEAVGNAVKHVGTPEHLTKRGLVHRLARLELLDRVGLEHGAVAVRRVRPRNLVLESLEEVVVRAAKDIAANCPAALVKPVLAQRGLAVGDTLLEGGDVVGEHLCFFGKELWLGLILPANTIVISIFSKQKQFVCIFVLIFVFT